VRVSALLFSVVVAVATAVVPSAQQPAFRATTDLVPLSVTVTNAEHQYVSDLTKDDFVVLEDGKPQTLSYFARSDVPLAVALLIDSSASMLTTLATAQEAAVGFVRELTERDLAMIIDFDTKVQIRQPFTSDHALLEEAILRTTAGGSTMLNTAVYIALRELSRLNVGDEGADLQAFSDSYSKPLDHVGMRENELVSQMQDQMESTLAELMRYLSERERDD
jgi:VWFA-related protein